MLQKNKNTDPKFPNKSPLGNQKVRKKTSCNKENEIKLAHFRVRFRFLHPDWRTGGGVGGGGAAAVNVKTIQQQRLCFVVYFFSP